MADRDAEKRIMQRLLRAQGQLNAVIRAVEAQKPCRDVITQLAATTKALESAGVLMISNAMHECLSDPEAGLRHGEPTAQDFEKMFLMLA